MAAPKEGGRKADIISEKIATDVSVLDPEIQIVDLYTVGHDPKHTTQPFVHQLDINTGIGGAVRVWANFDDGALANAMSVTKFQTIKHRLGYYKPSSRWLRMADGSIVKPMAVWKGSLEIEGVQVFGSFEVFDSGGNWEFLLGKPLLTAFHAIHEYTGDKVSIENNGVSALLKNQVNTMRQDPNTINQGRGKEPERQDDSKGSNGMLLPREVLADSYNKGERAVDVANIGNIETDEAPSNYVDSKTTAEVDVDILKDKDNVFTRLTEPFKKERVDEILKQVKIGPDLTDEERRRVREFIADWADIFALSVNEVKPVENAVHHLNIPPGATFSTKIGQKPLTPPQRRYLYESVDIMLKAGIIEQCLPDQVKCVSPTTLAQKAHAGSGLVLEELQHRTNNECIAHGFEPFFNLPPRSQPTPDDESDKSEPKWRICQNFSQINKVTKIAPMPQGDIRAKQQRLSGHR